jgi:hypothetical protein
VLNISRHCYLSKGLSAVPDLETRNFFLHTVELRCRSNHTIMEKVKHITVNNFLVD